VGSSVLISPCLIQASGEFKKYNMGDDVRPHNLIIDDQGIVWYAGNTRGYIGRLDPATAEIKKYAMPNDDVSDPHTLVFDSVTPYSGCDSIASNLAIY